MDSIIDFDFPNSTCSILHRRCIQLYVHENVKTLTFSTVGGHVR